MSHWHPEYEDDVPVRMRWCTAVHDDPTVRRHAPHPVWDRMAEDAEATR